MSEMEKGSQRPLRRTRVSHSLRLLANARVVPVNNPFMQQHNPVPQGLDRQHVAVGASPGISSLSKSDAAGGINLPEPPNCSALCTRQVRWRSSTTEKMAQTVELKMTAHGDSRGQLIALEALSAEVPFEVKRVYYIYDTTPGTVRGQHAHKDLSQLLICISGACTVECELPNGERRSYRLDWPDKGLLIRGLVWREMKYFSKDAVLLVLASEHYDESDYIRDYNSFRQLGQQYGLEDK